MQHIDTTVQKIINDFNTTQTREMLKDIGLDAFKEKFLSIAVNMDLSDVDDPESKSVFIENIDEIIAAIEAHESWDYIAEKKQVE